LSVVNREPRRQLDSSRFCHRPRDFFQQARANLIQQVTPLCNRHSEVLDPTNAPYVESNGSELINFISCEANLVSVSDHGAWLILRFTGGLLGCDRGSHRRLSLALARIPALAMRINCLCHATLELNY